MQSYREVEVQEWTGYHTYLAIFISVTIFFSVFATVFSGLILNRMAISFGWDPSTILIIFSIIGIASLFTIIPRYLTDKYGRKPLILIINFVFFAATLGSALAPTTLAFVIFQFLAGFFGIDLYSVIISEEVPARHRGKTVGIVAGIGMAAGLLASYLFIFTGISVDAWRYIYAIVCLIAVITITMMWFKIKETSRFISCKVRDLAEELGECEEDPGVFTRWPIFKIFQKKYLKILALSSMLLFFTEFLFLTIKRYYVVFLVTERITLGFNEAMIGMWSMFVYIGSIIGYYFAGILADKFGHKKAIYLSGFIYFIGSLLFLYGGIPSMIFAGLFIINFSYSIYRLVAEIFTVVFFPTKLRAIGSGWVFVFAAVAGIAGNFLMFFLFGLLGGWVNMFLIVGTICLIGLVAVTSFIPETNGRTVEEIFLTEIVGVPESEIMEDELYPMEMETELLDEAEIEA
ncbi:MAG TPA: MFS transporter [Candidatus Deferrimicrobium sp.]|nr:MFS transporter [Candidatus Deferrimicrobium sp.]